MIAVPSQTVTYGAVFIFGVLLAKRLLTARARRGVPLPPGPKGWPIIGNILDMPQGKKWAEFARWRERWGDLIYLNMFGQPMVIVNDVDVAVAMLDKKSAIYSDRPALLVAGKIVGFDNGVAIERYGDRWREKRRMMHRHVSTRASMENFYGAEELETHRLLRRILERPEPEQLPKHIRLTAGAIILMISHGYPVKEKNDYFVRHADQALTIFSEAISPGRFLVDTFPILRFVPEWFPGAAWKRTAKQWRKTLLSGVDLAHEYVKQQMQAGTAIPSFTSMGLEQGDISEDTEYMLKWVAHSIMGAGADTTVCASYSFFLAMVLYPEVQKQAQKELDAVIGNDRLPTINDRSRLPYIDAIAKEVLRWNPVAPLGISHGLVEDDIQNGYFIPKGTIVVPNVWKFLQDEQTYKDPFEFRPERFLASAERGPEKDPRDIAFGFGRRICPGLLLADSSLFLTCSMVLSVFNISKTIENGVPITPKKEFVNGIVNHPKLFTCSVKPRSKQAETIIKSVEFVEQ